MATKRESSGNSSLDKHSADLLNFGHSQTPSLVSRPKFSKSNESHTENPSVVLNNTDLSESSLRDSANAESRNDKYKSDSQSADSSESNKQSKRLRCCFGLFSRETSEIGLERPSSEVLCENNPNEYQRPNCKQDNAEDNKEPKLRPIIKGANGLSLGISIVVAILLGIGAGILMQKIFGVFWVLFLGVAWGIAAAILNVYKVYRAQLRDFEKLANDPKYRQP